MNDKLSKLAKVHKNYLITHNLYDTRTLTWDQKRQCGIGGSDIGAICGVNSYKTAYDVYLDKTVGSSFTGNNITYFGHVMEAHIADMFQEQYKDLFEVRIERKHFKCRDYPWLNGNIDRKLIDLKTGEAGVLEIKTTRTFNNDEWGKGCAFGIDYKLIISDNQVPESYFYQVQHYLLCTGFSCIDADSSIIEKVAELKAIRQKIEQLLLQEEPLKTEIQDYIGENEILLDVTTEKPLVTWKSSERRTFDTNKFKSEHEDLYNEYLKLSTSRRFTIK